MTLQIYAILFYCKRGYFCKLKTDFHVEKIDVIKLSKSQFHRKHIDRVLTLFFSQCGHVVRMIMIKSDKNTQATKNRNYFFSQIYIEVEIKIF